MIPIEVRVLKHNWLIDVSVLTASQEARGPRILILEVSSNHVPQPQNQEEKGHERYSRSCEYKVRESSLLPSNYIKLQNGPTRKPFLARDHTILLFSFLPFFQRYNCCCRRGCYCRCCCCCCRCRCRGQCRCCHHHCCGKGLCSSHVASQAKPTS